MFVVLLKFSENKSKAGEYMDGHNQWIKQGFEDGVFLWVGSLQSNLGGSVIVDNTPISELKESSRALHNSRSTVRITSIERTYQA
jgi:hypothetical protein